VFSLTRKKERMSDCLGGALVSEVLKGLIKEAKTVIDFKLLFEELASTMKIMIPLTEQIDTIQGNADFDFGDLKETIQRARKVVDKCQRTSGFTRNLRSQERLRESIRICSSSARWTYSFFSTGTWRTSMIRLTV